MYHFIPTMWKNKVIENGLTYADSIIKEMTNFFETRVENLEPKEEKKKIQLLPRNPGTRNPPRNRNK